MTKIQPEDDQEEKPLDPAMESVRRKMIRLQIVSGVIMFVSLMAVFGAVVYKTMRSPRTSQAAADIGRRSVGCAGQLRRPRCRRASSSSRRRCREARSCSLRPAGATASSRALVVDIKAGRIVADIDASTATRAGMAARLVAIESADDPRIAEFRDIRERDLTGRQNRFIAEGTVVLRMLADAPCGGSFADRKGAAARATVSRASLAILESLPDDVPVYVAEAEVLDRIVGFICIAACWRSAGASSAPEADAR